MKRGLVSHIEIYVSDLEKSANFWGWFLAELGYQAHQTWDLGKSWKLDATYFVIVRVEDKFKNNPYHRKNVGLNHLAFHAESPADVENMTAALKSRAVTILYPDRYPHAGGKNTCAVFFEDPDRIKVEFVAS